MSAARPIGRGRSEKLTNDSWDDSFLQRISRSAQGCLVRPEDRNGGNPRKKSYTCLPTSAGVIPCNFWAYSFLYASPQSEPTCLWVPLYAPAESPTFTHHADEPRQFRSCPPKSEVTTSLVCIETPYLQNCRYGVMKRRIENPSAPLNYLNIVSEKEQ